MSGHPVALRRRESWWLQVKGGCLFLLIGVLAWLAVAAYNKTFVASVDVTVRAGRSGLQLPENGDVRMRGTIIGRVTSISTAEGAGGGVAIGLALDPEAARLVPVDAQARILPTTLFGQKYVELVAPAPHGRFEPVVDGALLREDTSAETAEITQVLDDLVPVLEAVRPQRLAQTLHALAEGLDGRGEQLGRTAVGAERYLAAIGQDLPQLAADLRLLGIVSRDYARATPDILDTLASATVVGTTILDDRDEMDRFLRDARAFARTTAAYLDENGDGLVELNAVTRPVLELLGAYSPEFPCLFAGLLRAESAAGAAFRDGAFHADVVLGRQYPGYTAEDLPRFGDLGRGPHCAGLPDVSGPVGQARSDDGVQGFRGSGLPLRLVRGLW